MALLSEAERLQRLAMQSHGGSDHLEQLGKQVAQPSTPEEALLELIPWSGSYTIARFTCPEFTSLCPVTGQPDFAIIVIDYEPRQRLVESKSLKLYLASFRNEGSFHETCTNAIFEKLHTALDPYWIRVAAFFLPRGGIPIDVICETGEISSVQMMKPRLDMREYRGR